MSYYEINQSDILDSSMNDNILCIHSYKILVRTYVDDINESIEYNH